MSTVEEKVTHSSDHNLYTIADELTSQILQEELVFAFHDVKKVIVCLSVCGMTECRSERVPVKINGSPLLKPKIPEPPISAAYDGIR